MRELFLPREWAAVLPRDIIETFRADESGAAPGKRPGSPSSKPRTTKEEWECESAPKRLFSKTSPGERPGKSTQKKEPVTRDDDEHGHEHARRHAA